MEPPRRRLRSWRPSLVSLDADSLVSIAEASTDIPGLVGLTCSCSTLFNLLHPRLHLLLPPPRRPVGEALKSVHGHFPPGTVVSATDDREDHGLSTACFADSDLARVKEALRRGAELNGIYGNSMVFKWSTPIGYACCLGKLEFVRHLLIAGADPNGLDAQGLRPLHRCSSGGHLASGGRADRPACALLLLRAGADPGLRCLRKMPQTGPTLGSGAWAPAETAHELAVEQGAAGVAAVLAEPPPPRRMRPRRPCIELASFQ